MPLTVTVIEVICRSGISGSVGAVASMIALPTKPLHCARPLTSMVAAGMVGGGEPNGLPILHSTGVDITVIGAILNVPVAMNCTFPPGEAWASAEAGVTVMLCS